MTDTGIKDRFEHWRSGFEENLKHELSSAGRSKKEAQLQELKLWKAAEKDSDQEAVSLSLEVESIDAKNGKSDNLEFDDFRKLPLTSWPKSFLSEDNLLEVMVEEMKAQTSKMFKDLHVLKEEEVLKQLDNVRNSVVKYGDQNYRTLMTKSVLRSFKFLSNVHINRVGVENQERRTNQAAIDVMLKMKVAEVVNKLETDSLTMLKLPIETGDQLLELNSVEKKTLELLGDGWIQYYCKSREEIIERLSRCHKQLELFNDKLKKLPVVGVGTAKVGEIYLKMIQSVLDELKCDNRLEGIISAVQQAVENSYRLAQEKIVVEEEIVSKAKKYACDRYLELMLERAEAFGKLEDVIPVHFEVRERIEVAFFTVPEFMYSLLWDFNFRDEDLIAQFRKERLNHLVSTATPIENDTENSTPKENGTEKSNPEINGTVNSTPEGIETEKSTPEENGTENSTAESTEGQVSHQASEEPTILSELLLHVDSSIAACESRVITTAPSLLMERLISVDLTTVDDACDPAPDRCNSNGLIQTSDSNDHSSDTSSPVICSVYSLPKKSVRIAMYFSEDSLNIMYKVDGTSHKNVFPLTIQLAHGPDGDLILADREKHATILNLDLSPYIRNRHIHHPAISSFKGLYPEVLLAAFIRKCMHQIHGTISVNLYDACVAVALPASIASCCRFRVKTALKLAGFRDSIIVQASTALTTTYAAKTGPTSADRYQLLTVFVDGNDIEVTAIEVVGGWQLTSMLVKVISIPLSQVVKPQNVLEAIYEFKYAVDCVFCMSPTTKIDFVPFCKELHVQRNFGRVVCVSLFVGLLPGLLNISSGKTRYQERFPWEITVGQNRFLLAKQNDLIPADQCPRLVLRFDQIQADGDTVTVHRRDAIRRSLVVEEVQLRDVQNLHQQCPNGDITVEVSKEGLVTLEFHSHTQVVPRIIKDTKHMAVNATLLQIALQKVDKMTVGFLNPKSCSSSSLRRRLSTTSSQGESPPVEKIIRID